jgi:hypothetical protein
LEDREDLSLFRNQVRTFISNLKSDFAYLNAENNTDFASTVLNRAERIFGKKEIKENVSEFYADDLHSPASGIGKAECLVRTKQLLDSMTTLLSYLEYEGWAYKRCTIHARETLIKYRCYTSMKK